MPKLNPTSHALASSILNYYAAFTETKFNFQTLINYRWTNDALTLDLSLFQNFQDHLLQQLKSGDTSPLSVSPNQYTLSVLGADIQFEIEKALSVPLNVDFLKTCISKEFAKIQEQIHRNAESKEEPSPSVAEEDLDPHEILLHEEQLKEKAFREGTRIYNRAVRKQLETILNELQEKKIDRLKAELGIENVPASIFNSSHYLKTHFDALQLLASECAGETDYFKKVVRHFKENAADVILYDLFINIQRYAGLHNTGTTYLFFHEFNKENDNAEPEAYPIFFVEADFSLDNHQIMVSFPRNLILINTPAVNYFRFPKVLTTPRSTTFQNAGADIGAVEVFLQGQYGLTHPFVLEPHFKPIAAPEDMYPDIKCRAGFQVVQKENKKLLDYSELMTLTASGGQSKFNGFIGDYIAGNVENTQDQVDREFSEKYPIKSPSRYIADNPLNLNNNQKRILLALQNQKNKILVVDGPPGTGKSHTIAALIYWANQQKKSVVVTSHKKEALDVIDRMLTEKFRNLHPQGKPSIVRFGKNGNSINTLENSLQNAVINAAGGRANNYNEPAAMHDAVTCKEKTVSRLERQLAASDAYDQTIADVFQFETLQEALIHSGTLSKEEAALPKLAPSIAIDFERIAAFAATDAVAGLKNITLPELHFFLKRKTDIPAFIAACEEINLHADKLPDVVIKTTDVPKPFVELLEKCSKLFKQTVPIHQLTAKDIVFSAALKHIIKKIPSTGERENLIKSLRSLQYLSIVEDIGRIQDVSPDLLTLQHITSGIVALRTAISLKRHQDIISEYRAVDPGPQKSIARIHETLSGVNDILDAVSAPLFDAISIMFAAYSPLLSKIGLSASNLHTISRLNELTEAESRIWQWVRLHYRLSKSSVADAVRKEDLDAYHDLKQREIEHINDTRLKNLNNFLTDIARIKVSFNGGKRFTPAQARVLLENISALIAEPDMISGFFPMDEDMMDLLIIDEASQVSIANSISLILRARQTVIFGDEYQYGAVSAVHVSSRYAESYFKEIIQAYSHEYNVLAAQDEVDSLLQDVSREISDDDLEAERVLRPQDHTKDNAGAILWLKTFNIRTSTLTFAKAIANYTTSLKEHYRSFPEIIDYSNEVFYKHAQLELMVNRIRTKPIGEVLRFVPVETKGNSGRNVNFDEIDAIIEDLETRIQNQYKGSIGIIASFREQQARLEEALHKRMSMPELKRNHKMAVWFVGDVQGEERDLVYYSFVEDKKFKNADLASIYPVIGGTADNIRKLKMQRLNVGFSRARDIMVFVHSMPINEYSNTRLGDALKHYRKLLDDNLKNDFFVEDTAIFGSPAEEHLYHLLVNTAFVKSNRAHIKIVPQFKIGEYIQAEFAKQIPRYRVDFLMTLSMDGREQALILEYDGVEFHTKNPDIVTRYNFSRQYLDYDIQRQIELESYGYRFLRLNKFNLRPDREGETGVDVLNRLLLKAFDAI